MAKLNPQRLKSLIIDGEDVFATENGVDQRRRSGRSERRDGV